MLDTVYRINRYLRTGRDYYFDATNGNDNNSGSYLSPKQTVVAANALSLLAGDRVLFKAAETWQATSAVKNAAAIRIPCSGVPERPIFYGRYGSGADPIFNQIVYYSDFALYDSPTYRRDAGGVEIEQVFESGVRLTKVANAAAVKAAASSWYYDGSTYLYVHTAAGGSPDGIVGYPAGAGYDDGFDTYDRSWITAKNLSVVGAKSHCFSMDQGNTGNGIVFENCTASFAGGRGFRIQHSTDSVTFTDTRLSSCIAHDTLAEGIWANGTRTIIEDCEVYDTKKDFTLKGMGAAGDAAGIIVGIWSDGVVARRNYIHDGYDNGLFWIEWESGAGASARPKNVIVEKNRVLHTVTTGLASALAFVLQGDNTCVARNNIIETAAGSQALNMVELNNGGTTLLYNNTFIQRTTSWVVSVDNAGSAPTLKNNILRNIAGNNVIYVGSGTAPVTDYNEYSGGAAGTGFYCQYAGADNNFAQFIANQSETHSLNSSPVLVNEASDYHLQTTSPCKNTGLNGLVVDDYASIPRDANTDIGCYEFV